ncbi:MAG: discoidin domain-containing protein, partial [Terracidiphilus sp.]
MSTSRRDFLKTTAIASAGVALSGIPALAEQAAVSAQNAEAPTSAVPGAASYTRGIGLYPGLPAENFSPALVPNTTTYRNLALLRPAYHSSSYDFNLTAQLVTDGIKDTRLPSWIVVSDNTRGPLPRTEREIIVNHAPMNTLDLRGAHAFVDIEMAGGDSVPEIDRIQLFVLAPPQTPASALKFSVAISQDGRTWQEVGSVAAPSPASTAGYPPDFAQPNQFFTPSIPFSAATASRFYRVQCMLDDSSLSAQAAGDVLWRLGEVAFYRGDKRVEIGGPYSFTSAWMSAGMDEEWVYVDLGAGCEVDRIALHWIARAAEGAIQVSDDAEHWRDVASLAGRTGQVDDVRLPQLEHGRYVRVLMTRPATPNRYLLSELEVYGRGGFVARAHAPALVDADGRLPLAGGAWRLQRASLISAGGEALSQPGFSDSEWLVATVPGTVLTSYVNSGAIADPNFGQNQLYISDSYFYSDFWYRTEFTAPSVDAKQIAWLNFDGINWKADVYLNGAKLGR